MSAVVLSNPLTVLGIFLLGAFTGALITFGNRKRVIGEMRELAPIPSVDRKGTTPESEAQLLMKAFVVSPGPELIETFSSLFREKHVATVSRADGAGAIDQFSTQRYEAIVLDFDKVAESADVLRRVREMNHRVLVIAVASDDSRKQIASDLGASIVIARPLVRTHIRQVLHSTYGRMLRDRQEYFRLAVDLPVWIRRRSGSLLQCAILNLSQRGMAVSAPSPFAVSEEVNLGFAIPNADIFVSADGRVVWDDRRGTAGITFECSNPKVQERYFARLHDHFLMVLDAPAQNVDTTEKVEHAR